MSVISTAANYGGKICDFQQGIKQFYISSGTIISWILKKTSTGYVITPSDSKKQVLINNDLIVTGATYNTSDERLKENIKSIDSDNLFSLNPILYSYKENLNKKQHYGLLAQNVEEVFPELVEENYFGYKSVNYQELIPIIISKMKNMQSEIDQLKEALNK
jgi:hypothetical protein